MLALRRYLAMIAVVLLLIGCTTGEPEITLSTSETGVNVKRGERIVALVRGGNVTESEVSLAGIAVPVEILSRNSISFVIPDESPSGEQVLRVKAGSITAQFKLTIVGDASASATMLIIVKPDVRKGALAGALAQFGFSLEGELSALGASSGPCRGMLAAVNVGGRDVKEAEKDLTALGEAFLLEPWGRAEDVSPLIDPESDYGVDSVHYLDAVGVSTAHNRGYGGKGVTIAILDTGVNEHEDLFGRVLDGRSFVGEADKGKVDIYSEGGSKLHGTPVALLAAGKMGVAPQADILPIRVCDANGNCSATAVIQGLCYALTHGAKTNSLNRMVLNLSWGSNQPSDIVKNILGYAGSQGVLTVTAAGNDYENDKNAINYPAYFDIDGLLTVAALKEENGNWGVTSYSNRGYHIDISAPGDDLALPTGRYSGTSFATALVAGSLALYRESFEYKHATAHEVESAVQTDAIKLAGTPREDAVGHGMINVRNLLDNEHVLRPIADRDNIHYYYFPDLDISTSPWADLMAGSYESFQVSSGSQGFVKFDLSGFAKPISSATLQVYRQDHHEEDCVLKAYEVSKDDWVEDDLYSLPQKGDELGLADLSSHGYAKIDISSYARSQQDDGVLSVALDCGLNKWVVIGAREGSFDEAPKLILGFED